MVDVPLPAVIGEVAATLDCAPDTVLACTTTVAVCVMATELIVADTVFASATGELRVPVATPSPVVGPLGCVSVFAVPVAANTTVAPAIELPNPSFAVTVIVDVPVPAAMGDVAVTVDCAADTAPAFTATVAVCVMATVLIVADTVLDPAAVDDSVPVATPFASVVAVGCVSVFPAVGVAASVTVAPWIGLPLASFAVTVIVAVPLPAVIGEVAVTVDCAADTVPAFTTTVAVCVIVTELIVADTVFDPAAVELNVPVATPFTSVAPTGCVSVLPVVGVANSVTVAPWMRLPLASRAVTVIVEVPPPATIGEVALTVDCVADTAPAFTTTVAVCVIATALIVADTVLDPAAVELRLPVATPLASVVAAGWVSVLPVVGVTASVTVAPAIGLPKASLAVTVMVDAAPPAVTGEVATTVDCAADTVPEPVILKPGDVPLSAPLDAARVYPVPALSMLSVEKVATPLTAATAPLPVSVPPPGLASSATVTVPVKPVAVFPCGSCAVTWTAGVIVASAVVLLGGTVKASWAAAP